MAIDKLPTAALESNAITADLIATGAITVSDIPNGEITADKLHTTLDLSTKTLTLPSSSVTSHISVALNDLTDVNTSGASSGNVITYNGSSWIVGTGGPANTDALTEGSSNLYYTDARARAAISENSTQLSYNNSTGVLTFTQGNTDTVAEGSSNLYYTDARTDARVALQTGTNLNLSSKSTTNLSEGSNLYYTSTRAQAETLGGSLSGTVSNARVQYGTSYSGTPAQGNFFFDSLNQKLKVYTGSTFVDAVPGGGGGGGGGGSTDANTTFRKYIYDVSSSTNSVSGKDSIVVTAGSFVTGYQYQIITVGNTDFTAIGASGNTVGVTFTATGTGTGTGTAGHVLNYLTNGTENVEVFVNGVKQVQGSSKDYVATTGSSVTFVSNLASGDVIDIQVYELLTNSAYYTQSQTYTQTQTNSQISTAVAGYLPLAGGTMTGTPVLNYQNPEIRFEDTDTSNNGEITLDNTSLRFESDPDNAVASSAIKFMVDGDTKATINSNGEVGIGMSSPSSTLAVETSSTASLSSYAGHIVVGPSTRTSADGDLSGGILFDQANGVQVSGKKGASITGFQDGSDVNSMGITFNVHGTDGSANRFEAMRIDSSGNLLLGKASANGTSASSASDGLEVRPTFLSFQSNTIAAYLNTRTDGIVLSLQKNGSAVGSIGTGSGTVYFANSTTGGIRLGTTSGSTLVIPCNETGATEDAVHDLGYSSARWRNLYMSGIIYGSDTSGNPVGNHNPGYMLHPTNGSHFQRDGGNPVRIGRDASDGSLTEWYRQGALVGNVGIQYTDNFYVAGNSSHTGLGFGSSTIYPVDSTGTERDAHSNLGSSNGRFKDLYLSGGVYLGGTGSANKLDDYEEGTHDITLNQGGVSVNSSYRTWRYTKIGRMVYIEGLFLANSGGDTNIIKINLPFTYLSRSGNTADQIIQTVGTYKVPTGSAGLKGTIVHGTSLLRFHKTVDNAVWTHLVGTEIAAGDHIYVNLAYPTN